MSKIPKAKMSVSEKSDISNILAEICNHLMINGSMVFYSGLLYGKMGISLFFFHYSQYTGNSLYSEYAQYLVNLVKAQIHKDYPLDYERGLAGVGTGFDYLKKQGFFDVGNDFMNDVDLKIIKAMSYERRISLLTGFGRYLLSRYNSNPNMKEALIHLVDLVINHSEETHTIVSSDTIFFLSNLYFLSIEREKIERYLSGLIEKIIDDVHKEPILDKLFTITRISLLPSFIQCQQVVHEIFKNIFAKTHTQFDLQWLVQYERFMNEKEYRSLKPKVKKNISKILRSNNLLNLDDLFSNNNNFALHGGYAGFGLSLISRMDKKSVLWTNLL